MLLYVLIPALALIFSCGLVIGRMLRPRDRSIPQLPQLAPSQERGIRGSLADLPVDALLNLLAAEKKTGALVILSGDVMAHILCRRGEVVSARYEMRKAVSGEEAVYAMLTARQGNFEFDPRPVGDGLESLGKTIQFLLMEGARRMDDAKKR